MSALYKIDKSPLKDGIMGMFADKKTDDKTIAPGDIILTEKALITAKIGPDAQNIYEQYKQLEGHDLERFKKLTFAFPKDKKHANEQLKKHPNDKAGEAVAKFETNCMTDSAGSMRYLCVEAARMNHSCWPNATYDYNASNESITVRALVDIPAEKEILISYVDVLCSKKARNQKFFADYHFECQCIRCSGAKDPVVSEKTTNELENAEAKVQAIRKQARHKGQDPDTADVAKQMDLCKELFRRAESRQPLMPIAVHALITYVSIAKKHSGTSEVAGAKQMFERGHELVRTCRGEAFEKGLRNELQNL